MALKLICTLSEEVVLTALEHMHSTSSLGLDGVPSSFYQRTSAVFAPQILHVVERMLQGAIVHVAWSLAIMNCIPKHPSLPKVTALRPICLQNSVFKWFAGSALVLLEDLIVFVTPKEQTAFLRSRHIFDHFGDRGGLGKRTTWGCF